MLSFDTFGEATDTPTLVIAHGLFGSGRNWRAIARRLAQGRRVVTVDMRNHGASFRSEVMDYPAMATDLLAVSARFGPVDLLGHSMGGKAAMVAALQAPEAVANLIVADIAPVAYTHTQLPLIDAMERVDLGSVSRRAEAETVLAETIAEPSVRAFLLQSLDTADSPARWLLNLPVLRTAMDAIIGFPEVAGTYDGRALFVTGAASTYVDAAGKARIRRHFSRPRFAALKDAGHWLHADQPKAFLATVQAFLGD